MFSDNRLATRTDLKAVSQVRGTTKIVVLPKIGQKFVASSFTHRPTQQHFTLLFKSATAIFTGNAVAANCTACKRITYNLLMVSYCLSKAILWKFTCECFVFMEIDWNWLPVNCPV